MRNAPHPDSNHDQLTKPHRPHETFNLQHEQTRSEQGNRPASHQKYSEDRKAQGPESHHRRTGLHRGSSTSEPPSSPCRRLPHMALEIERRRIRHGFIPRQRATCPPSRVHPVQRAPTQTQRPTPMPPSVLHPAQSPVRRLTKGEQPGPPDQNITWAPPRSLHPEI